MNRAQFRTRYRAALAEHVQDRSERSLPLAFADDAAIQELLQLVAEHAVELVDARSCSIAVRLPMVNRSITAFAGEASGRDFALHESELARRASTVRRPLLA